MRSTIRSLVVVAGLCALVPSMSSAQTTFPATATWQPIKRAGVPIAAATGATNAYEDIVGDNTTAGAAAYVYADANYMYFRIRIDADPGNNAPAASTQIRDRVYGCEIDTDGDDSYEFLASYDGINTMDVEVSLRQNVGAGSGTRTDLANSITTENPPGGYPNGTFGKVTAVGSDYFVDIAVARAPMRTAGAPDSKTLRFACGTGSIAGSLDLQLFNPNAVALSTMWSDPVVCGDAGCALDSDSDGVIDTLEATLGTNASLKDTDGDGIPDNVELSASGSAGPYTAIDTDGDGTIDAKDSDSDNDCIADSTEGQANYRTKAANPSSVCGTANAPVCQSTTGLCSACDGNHGAGTPAACPSASTPACQASGACTQCSASNTTLCTVATPACATSGLTMGTCQQCNGDRG